MFSTSARKRKGACGGRAVRVTLSSARLAARVASVAGGYTERQQSAQAHIAEERSVPERAAENANFGGSPRETVRVSEDATSAFCGPNGTL